MRALPGTFAIQTRPTLVLIAIAVVYIRRGALETKS